MPIADLFIYWDTFVAKYVQFEFKRSGIITGFEGGFALTLDKKYSQRRLAV